MFSDLICSNDKTCYLEMFKTLSTNLLRIPWFAMYSELGLQGCRSTVL